MVLTAFSQPQVLQIFTLNEICVYTKHISHTKVYTHKISINCRLSALSNSINLRQCHTFQVARYACSWLLHMHYICKMQHGVYIYIYMHGHILQKRSKIKYVLEMHCWSSIYAQPMKRTFIFSCIVVVQQAPTIPPTKPSDARKEKWWKWKIMLHYCCRAAQQLYPLTIYIIWVGTYLLVGIF